MWHNVGKVMLWTFTFYSKDKSIQLNEGILNEIISSLTIGGLQKDIPIDLKLYKPIMNFNNLKNYHLKKKRKTFLKTLEMIFIFFFNFWLQQLKINQLMFPFFFFINKEAISNNNHVIACCDKKFCFL